MDSRRPSQNRFATRWLTVFLDPLPPYGKILTSAALLLWFLVVVAGALQHEMWRDEVRALSMALDGSSFWDLFSVLRNEGHPILWYAILRFAHTLYPNPVVLQMASIIVASVGIYLVLQKSPFPLLIKLLFVFGVIPVVEYAISARNYGISMTLFFAFAVAISRSPRPSLIIGVILALLANTNYLALIFSALLTGWWVIDSRALFVAENRIRLRFLAGVGLAACGILVSYLTIAMDGNSSQAPPAYLKSIDWLPFVKDAITHPGHYINALFNPHGIIRDLVPVLFILGLAPRPLLMLTMLVALVIYNVLGGALLTPQLRHQGVFYCFLLTAYWITLAGFGQQQATTSLKRLGRVVTYLVVFLVFIPFMVLNIGYTRVKFLQDTKGVISSSYAFGAFLNTNYQFRDAIIIGEPDYMIQALPYYAKNRIYIVREQRFANYIRYLKTFPEKITLTDILDAAQMLVKTENVPVLIALKHWDMTKKEPFVVESKGKRGFVTNFAEIRRLRRETIKIAEFNNVVSDEAYRIFMVPRHNDFQGYRKQYGDQSLQLPTPTPE